MKLVGEVMSTGITSCHPRTPIRRVARRMRDADVSALPVLDGDGNLVGIVSQTDLVTLRAYRDEWDQMTAEHVMVHNVLTTTPSSGLQEACDMMISNKVHRLIVVEPNEDNSPPRVVGVLSMTDVVREMAEEDLPDAVDTIVP